MSAATYPAKAIVLSKTKLKESDLILRMLSSDGSLLEAIAKGARKPNSSSSGRLELFNSVEMLLVKGKNLDIIKETRLIRTDAILHSDPVYNACASTIAECAAKLAQPSLESLKAYPMTNRAFEVLAGSKQDKAVLIVAAYLFKSASIAGCKPSISSCSVCGSPLSDRTDSIRFSFDEGGVVCDLCRSSLNCEYISPNSIDWVRYLIASTFADISQISEVAQSLDLVNFAARWLNHQLGIKLKSLSSLLIYCTGM